MGDAEKFLIEQPPEVHAALNKLYRLFRGLGAGRRVNHWIDGAHSPEECAALEAAGSSKRVRDLTQHEFDHLAWHAMCWDGEHPETLTYFLPRVFDEHFTVVTNAVPIEFFVSNLRKAGWPGGWKDDQVAAVSELMDAVYAASLSSEADGYRMGPTEILWMVAALRLDVGPSLDRWRQARTVAATVQLAQFVTRAVQSSAPNAVNWWREVWDGDPLEPEVQRRVADWLLSPETATQLEEAFFAAADGRSQRVLSEARERLWW